MNLLVVDFEITTTNQKFHAIRLLVDKTINLRKTIWDDTAKTRVSRHTQHSMGLTATCLAISEDRTVVTLNYRFDEGECTLIINSLLLRISVIDRMEGEIFWWTLPIWSRQHNLVILFVNF